MNILNLENISKTYMAKAVLEDVCIGIDASDKIGIVGSNGTGKSTLLSITAGVVDPDEGKVVMGNEIRISYLPQNPQFDMKKSLLENITDTIYASGDHWDKMGEIKAELAKFGIDEPNCNPAILSGGQKKRAALVAAIMTPSDLLILDEPTNHLDAEMIEWLEEYLRKYRGAVLMVTHDRYFLDEVTNQIIELDKGKAYRYEANYSGFLELKQQRLNFEQAAERKAAALYKKDLAWMLRGARARSTKQKAHIKRFEELRDRERPEQERSVQLSSLPSRMGNKTILLEDISKSYGEQKLFAHFTYTFQKLDRIGIIGSNGCGKSTLLKCIVGDVLPDTGKIELGQTVRIGYFSQEYDTGKQEESPQEPTQERNASIHIRWAKDENIRVIDFVKETAEYIQTTDGQLSASAMCERFLFDANMQYAPISKLSGGEKRRLYLLKVLMASPNVIVLDEPTNDLDIQTLRILEDYLDSFAGIVITVSHDRYFLDRVVTRIFSFEPDGALLQSEGGYSDYLAHKEQRYVEQKRNERNVSEKRDAAKEASGKSNYRAPREKKKLSYKEQREYESIEEEIAALEERSAELERLMATATTDFNRLMELTREKEKVDAEIEQKLERFLELQEMVDSFSGR
ncbi:MAG: ABC-F family ATP-binding cassette domain-containing protein [Lachnospiraceae bacterium]|nr:ABC-F family ATP-binding cassette domain-containing protein [Lachnospiraceae bacterium]